MVANTHRKGHHLLIWGQSGVVYLPFCPLLSLEGPSITTEVSWAFVIDSGEGGRGEGLGTGAALMGGPYWRLLEFSRYLEEKSS